MLWIWDTLRLFTDYSHALCQGINIIIVCMWQRMHVLLNQFGIKLIVPIGTIYIVCCTSPSACGASPLWPEPSSAAPQWCRASSSSCTTRGFPCITQGCACWSATVGRKTQSPGLEAKDKPGNDKTHCENIICQTSTHLPELSCQWAWWQTSCRWRKCFWFHSRGIQSLVTTWD